MVMSLDSVDRRGSSTGATCIGVGLAGVEHPETGVALLRRRPAGLLPGGGWEPLEVYPFATLRLLGLPTEGKRTELGRRRIHHALQELVPGLDHPAASEHQLDAVVCALTAHLANLGQTRTVGAA